MFKKILQSLSKSQQAKTQAPAKAPVPASAPAGRSGVLDRVVRPGAPAVAPQTPEDLCEVNSKMPKDQIQARLKLLYRRFNRSASSLDPKIRSEADQMLNAIVLVREKHFGEL